MKDLIERRAHFNIAADLKAKRIGGIAVRYGDTASIGGQFYERIEPGAFGDIGDVVMNVQHDRGRPIARTGGGGLELTDEPDILRCVATPVDTQEGRDALLMVEHRVLRGLSIEFRCKREDFVDDTRIVREAELVGLALVDRPAYGESVAQVAARMAKHATKRRRWL